jgi:hypothetical protein
MKFVPLKKNKTLDSNNLKTASKMLKEIPQKPNHIIKGFEEITPCNDSLPILYEPIYERVFPLNTVYWDKSRSERIYLISDTQGINCDGQFVKINPKLLGFLVQEDKAMFFTLLSQAGYTITNGKLEFLLNYGDIFVTEDSVIVMYLSDGYHTTTNKIVDSKIERRACEEERKFFFALLKNNGFAYYHDTKSITESERYYYFPSYSLYNGFQPEKKKWINSDADKFYEKHAETFDTFAACANWCNVINKALRRDYPDIEEL